MRNLTIPGKITIFKTLDLSKVTHLALVTAIPKATNLKLKKIQIEFIWSSGTLKIKNSTLHKSYENKGLKM